MNAEKLPFAMPSFDLNGKVAVVTGGTKGLGYGIVMVFVMTSRHQEDCDVAAAEVAAMGGEAMGIKADVQNVEEIQNLVDRTVEKYGRLDIMVNNAGVAPEKRVDLLEMTEESYDRVVSINAKGTLFFTQAVARQMCTQEIIGSKRGTIINISSCSAEVVSRSRGEYCISKAGISMITKLFAERLAGDGILVHEVRPGIISTDMTSAVKDKYDRLIREGCFPIARWGKPEDVANAVSALAGDGFLYTTGNYIDIDGGSHIKTL